MRKLKAYLRPSLTTFFKRSIQRYLSEKKYPFNLLKDNEFEKSRKVLAAKRKSLVHDHAKETNRKLLTLSTKTKRMPFFSPIQRDVLEVFTKNSAVTGQCKMNAPEWSFHLAVRHNRRSNEEVLYEGTPRKNDIGKFLSTAAKNAGLYKEGKKVTNHSVRKTCISRLLDADVPENFVAQLSGHKSTESLQSYKSASAKHQKRMSLTLSRADVSGSRDEALSSVHNQGFEVVTRSTTDIAASSTTTTLIDQSSDPLLSSTAPIFTGANIGSISGCTFQIFHGNVKIVQNERKRRIVIDSDEDDWLWSYFLSTLSSFELIFTASLDTDLIHIL